MKAVREGERPNQDFRLAAGMYWVDGSAVVNTEDEGNHTIFCGAHNNIDHVEVGNLYWQTILASVPREGRLPATGTSAGAVAS